MLFLPSSGTVVLPEFNQTLVMLGQRHQGSDPFGQDVVRQASHQLATKAVTR